jgi:hypothetical protein
MSGVADDENARQAGLIWDGILVVHNNQHRLSHGGHPTPTSGSRVRANGQTPDDPSTISQRR